MSQKAYMIFETEQIGDKKKKGAFPDAKRLALINNPYLFRIYEISESY